MKKILNSLAIIATLLGVALISGCTAAKNSTTPTVISDFRIERGAYDLAYDGQHRQARWVYEYLTSDSVDGAADRGKCVFKEDPLIPVALQATNADYTGSGFDRGHLCPAGDARVSDKAMKETFFLSNISPQHPQFNRGYWLKLERHVRELAKKHGSIHVFTGGLYLPHQEADGRRYVKYQVIGANDVAVPTHYFKVVLSEDGIPVEAYIMPNEAIATNIPLEKFTTTIEKIERAAGIVFIP